MAAAATDADKETAMSYELGDGSPAPEGNSGTLWFWIILLIVASAVATSPLWLGALASKP